MRRTRRRRGPLKAHRGDVKFEDLADVSGNVGEQGVGAPIAGDVADDDGVVGHGRGDALPWYISLHADRQTVSDSIARGVHSLGLDLIFFDWSVRWFDRLVVSWMSITKESFA